MLTSTILHSAKAAHSTIRRIRRMLHRNPELSFREYETSAYIQSELQRLGIAFRVMATTGVVAEIGTGERCVALRADIDALPIQEETHLEYSSENPGIMHACGHDAHTAMLLGAASLLKEYELQHGVSSIGGVVKLIFQPGEELSPGGASIMIREGVLENPRPEAIFGQHVNPEGSVGTVAFVSGTMMASTDELYWTIRSAGGHAAQPHMVADPILLAAHLITQLQTLVSRRLNPIHAGVLSVCTIHGGHATNVIPDTVELSGTLRSMDTAWREEALRSIHHHTEMLASSPLFGTAQAELRIVPGYPALVNHPATTHFARQAAEKLLGASHVQDFEPKMWGEDFAYYTREIPGTFWMLGVRPPDYDSIPSLHNPKFILDEDALPIGAALLAYVALQYLATPSRLALQSGNASPLSNFSF
ncbi:MAG: M20 family metallopeptidase [Bacteroidota bacterium]|nr:M20 family metallopeptidase [Candidatus Kapabacteria bacterium]MDW8220747.1 M20 family metallopeptidase [Bacteroidota bacterium]